MPNSQPESIDITPSPAIRARLLAVWADPREQAFRDAVLADPATLRWLDPVCYERIEPSDPDSNVCHRQVGHVGDHADWSPEECLVEECACTEQENEHDYPEWEKNRY